MTHPMDVRPPGKPVRTPPAASRWTVAGLSAGALALLVATSALGEDEPTAVSAQAAGDEQICSPGEACTLMNGLAAAADRKPVLRTYAEAFEAAQPAEACPQAIESYAEVGIEIDGVLGPCPQQVDAVEAGQAAARAAAASLEVGGSR